MEYNEAIEKLIQTYPGASELKGKFSIDSGELSYHLYGYEKVDIVGIQKYINEILGQKVYRVEYVGYVDVYATDEWEARQFIRYLKPKSVTISETKEREF